MLRELFPDYPVWHHLVIHRDAYNPFAEAVCRINGQ
jgi:hypothetical protein